MIDSTSAGMRCRAIREIRTCQGLIRRFAEGIIQFDMENLGRRLVRVKWDSGIVDYAYPVEIEILGPNDIASETRI